MSKRKSTKKTANLTLLKIIVIVTSVPVLLALALFTRNTLSNSGPTPIDGQTSEPSYIESQLKVEEAQTINQNQKEQNKPTVNETKTEKSSPPTITCTSSVRQRIENNYDEEYYTWMKMKKDADDSTNEYIDKMIELNPDDELELELERSRKLNENDVTYSRYIRQSLNRYTNSLLRNGCN